MLTGVYSDLHHNVELFSVKGEYENRTWTRVYNKAVLDLPIEAIETAERYGYHSVWTAEAYGSDALNPRISRWKTTTIKLGTAVVQVAARTPASTAMAQ